MNWLVGALMLACMKRGVAEITEPGCALGTTGTTTAAATPCPVSVTVAEYRAVSAPPATVTFSAPVAAPSVVAVYCTLIWQPVLAARVRPQLLLCVNPLVVLICRGDTANALTFCKVN